MANFTINAKAERVTIADGDSFLIETAANVTMRTTGSDVFTYIQSKFTTSYIQVPTVIGGAGIASTLTLKATSGNGGVGSDIIFQVGNNGATEAMRINNAGRVAIGTNTFDVTNPEGLVVQQNHATSVNAIVGKGTLDSYLQLNIKNQSGGTASSSDIVATANNGTEILNFIDMGINGSAYVQAGWTINGADDGYLYTSDGNLSIGTKGAKYLSFFTGGTLLANERMRITSAGNVGIGCTPAYTLDIATSAANARGVNVVTSSTSGNIYGVVVASSGASNINCGYHANISGATNNYGLEIVNPPEGANNYAIRSSATAKSYFAGNIGIGIDPTNKLHIATSTANDQAIRVEHTGATGTNYGIVSTITGAGTTNYGLYVNATGATNNNGIVINNPSAGANNYAIYSSATAKSYIEGKISIGIDSTFHKINVYSDTAGWATIYAYNGATSGTNYGINVAAAGGGATTNYGILVSASGATNNRGIYTDAGIPSGANNYVLYSSSAAQSYHRGNFGFGVGATAPAYPVDVIGAAGLSTGTLWTNTCDARIKEDIQDANLDQCYNDIKNLKLSYFKLKDNFFDIERHPDRHKVGWIADDVEKIFPKAVGRRSFKGSTVMGVKKEKIKNPETNEIEIKEEPIYDIIEDCKTLTPDSILSAMFGALQKTMITVENLEKKIIELQNKK